MSVTVPDAHVYARNRLITAAVAYSMGLTYHDLVLIVHALEPHALDLRRLIFQLVGKNLEHERLSRRSACLLLLLMVGGRTRAVCEGRVELRVQRASLLFYLGVGVFVAAQGYNALGALAEDADHFNGTYRLLLAALAQARVIGKMALAAAVALVLLVV